MLGLHVAIGTATFLCCIKPRVDVKVHHRCCLHRTGDQQDMCRRDFCNMAPRLDFLVVLTCDWTHVCVKGVGGVIYFFLLLPLFEGLCSNPLCKRVVDLWRQDKYFFIIIIIIGLCFLKETQAMDPLSCTTFLMKCFGVNRLIRLSRNWSI